MKNDEKITFGSVKSNDDSVDKRIDVIIENLQPILEISNVFDYVIIERSFIANSGDTSRMICELQGIIKNQIRQCPGWSGVILQPSPTTWRSVFPGNGRADKKAAIEAVRLNGHDPTNDDEADAICLLFAFGEKLIKTCIEGSETKRKAKTKKLKKVA